MPPIKAVEQADFGGVDSRSNPIRMPDNRWLWLRNWVPRQDGHLELRDGYMPVLTSPPTSGEGAIYSIYSFKQQAFIGKTVGQSMVQTPTLNTLPAGNYYAILMKETAGGLSESSAEMGPITVDGTHALQIIDIPQDDDAAFWRVYFGTASGQENQSVRVSRAALSITGWKITINSPGDAATPPLSAVPCVLFWQNKQPRVLNLTDNSIWFPAIRQNPIISGARWSYALGKNGYTYMHNGVDMKFFDGFTFRDIGLPVLTADMVAAISVAAGLSAPSAADADGVSFRFVTATSGPPSQANVISGLMYMAYFDKTSDTLAPCAEPLSGAPFPNGVTQTNKFLQVHELPPKSGAVTLLYYPGQGGANPTLQSNTLCQFYSHHSSYASQFEYANASDTYGGGIALPGSPSATFTLADNHGLLFNPGDGQAFPGWAGATNGHIYPMVVAGVNSLGKWDGTTAVIWSGSASGNWVMTVEGQLSVPAAGEYTFILAHDDGCLIGFGSGASYVSGFVDPAFQQITADKGYPVMCSRQTPGLNTDRFTVSFPAAGVYNFEIDYCNWETAQTCALYNGDGSVILPPVDFTSSASLSNIGPSFLTDSYGQDGATLSMSSADVVNVNLPGHGLSDGDVIVLALHKHDTPDYATPYSPVEWSSNGPFTVSVVDTDNFTFNSTDAIHYDGATPITIYTLIQVTASDYTIDTDNTGWPFRCQNNRDKNASGAYLLPDPTIAAGNLLAPSTIGGDQPGYQFYASIYNPHSGFHVGNRVAIGQRLVNTTECAVIISGLPDISVGPFRSVGGASAFAFPRENPDKIHKFFGNRKINPQLRHPILGLFGQFITPDSEWVLLIGRTYDGGEVPYAIIDSAGNWITTESASQDTITISSGKIDGNSELPTENNIPPPFQSFWREADRMCGSIIDEPFVYRCGSELDDNTGIFVGDPAQSWSPARVETFPSAVNVVAGFSCMQESWVFTVGELATLSELSGEVAWNGPYNFGIAGRHAFDTGWKGLPFWVSHDKQLCTMISDQDGPISISTEYEAALLARIDDLHLEDVEVVYFRDSLRMVEILMIRGIDDADNPFTVVHDFNLRDDSSPYGQGYEWDFEDALSAVYTEALVRDFNDHKRVWAGGEDGNLYQFFIGGNDNGTDFTADGINLRYVGGEHTAVKTLEWYGDGRIQWWTSTRMNAVTSPLEDPTASNFWVDLTDQMRPWPGDELNSHWMADMQRPEVLHIYFWMELTSHPDDAEDPDNPMALNTPPHIPVEFYGRLYMSAPNLGDSRGR